MTRRLVSKVASKRVTVGILGVARLALKLEQTRLLHAAFLSRDLTNILSPLHWCQSHEI